MKNIIITGTSRGIGFELALQFANAGHQVLAISRKMPQALIENKNIKEFVNLLENSEKNDLLNAEKLLEGFPSRVGSFTEKDIEDIKEQLRAFIKDEKIKHPLKSNPFSYLPDDFKLSI